MPTHNLIEYSSNHSKTTGSIETIAVSLKYLSIFWRSLEKPLINCKTELKLKWAKYSVLSANDNDSANDNPNNITFIIKYI